MEADLIVIVQARAAPKPFFRQSPEGWKEVKRCSMTEWNAGSFDENVMPRLTWISSVAFSPSGVSA